MTGKLVDISRSYEGRLRVMFEVDSVDEIRGMDGKELDITVTRKGKKRSLNANAYFHVLMGKIADRMAISKPRCKNMLLGRYGQRWIEHDKPLELRVVSEYPMEENETLHCIPTGFDFDPDGTEYTIWAVVRPSHEYDSVEMAHLIEGTISEAKDLGIETLPPAELERMMKSWSQYYSKKENVSSAEPQ